MTSKSKAVRVWAFRIFPVFLFFVNRAWVSWGMQDGKGGNDGDGEHDGEITEDGIGCRD